LLQVCARHSFAQDPVTATLVHIYGTRNERVPDGQAPSTSIGAGFFISEDGVVLTAYHVIQGATDVEIFMQHGEHCTSAKLLAYDEHHDLAKLKCDPPGGKAPALPIEERFEPLPMDDGIVYGHPNGKLTHSPILPWI
jgi:S1-C subfamily serine protease